MHWRTLRKILEHSQPPGYRLARARSQPKLGPYVGRIEQILQEDRAMPRKQRHTAKRIFERLREAGYAGGYAEIAMAVLTSPALAPHFDYAACHRLDTQLRRP